MAVCPIAGVMAEVVAEVDASAAATIAGRTDGLVFMRAAWIKPAGMLSDRPPGA